MEITPRTTIDKITISSDLMSYWRFCVCAITGRVVRDIGGVDYPACNVRVHICEIDRWPWLIAKLRDEERRTSPSRR